MKKDTTIVIKLPGGTDRGRPHLAGRGDTSPRGPIITIGVTDVAAVIVETIAGTTGTTEKGVIEGKYLNHL